MSCMKKEQNIEIYRLSPTFVIRSYVPEVVARVQFGSGCYWIYIWSDMHVHKWDSSWNPNNNALECDDRPVACVITQQYSSGAFFSLLSDFRKKNSGWDFYLTLLPLQDCVCWVVHVMCMNYRSRCGLGGCFPVSYREIQGSIPDRSVCDLWLAEWQGIRFCSQ